MKKYPNSLPEEIVIFKKLDKIFPTDEKKLNMISTSLGMAAEMTLFIMEHKDFLNIPIKVQYCMANTCGNMAALTAPGFEKKDLGEIDYGKTDLTFEKKLGLVIKQLYEMCKEEG
jgi:hypothetical protein